MRVSSMPWGGEKKHRMFNFFPRNLAHLARGPLPASGANPSIACRKPASVSRLPFMRSLWLAAAAPPDGIQIVHLRLDGLHDLRAIDADLVVSRAKHKQGAGAYSPAAGRSPRSAPGWQPPWRPAAQPALQQHWTVRGHAVHFLATGSCTICTSSLPIMLAWADICIGRAPSSRLRAPRRPPHRNGRCRLVPSARVWHWTAGAGPCSDDISIRKVSNTTIKTDRNLVMLRTQCCDGLAGSVRRLPRQLFLGRMSSAKYRRASKGFFAERGAN